MGIINTKQKKETIEPPKQQLLENNAKKILQEIEKEIFNPNRLWGELGLEGKEIYPVNNPNHSIIVHQGAKQIFDSIEKDKTGTNTWQKALQEVQSIALNYYVDQKQYNLPTKEFYSTVINKINHEKQWREFLISLLKCVKVNTQGEIIGIDTEKRRELIRLTALVDTGDGVRFSDYIKKRNAGNVVILTSNAHTSQTVQQDELQLQQNHQSEVREQIGQIKIAQSIRYKKNDKLSGRGLYGGLAGPDNSRLEAAINNAGEKLALSTLDANRANEIIEKFQTFAEEGALEILAYSVSDVSYIINSFLPTKDFLSSMKAAGEMDEKTFHYYRSLLDNDEDHSLDSLLNSSDTLKLATSDTHLLNLEAQAFNSQEILTRLTDKKVSEPYKNVKYRLEFRPLLCCLYPQDYFYPHEFFCGILPTLQRQLNRNLNLTKTCLSDATRNIVARIKQDITKAHLPSQVYGLQPEEMFEVWKDLTEIHFSKFMRRYPGLKLQAVLRLTGDTLRQIEQELQTIWRNERDNVIMLITTLMDNPDISYHEDLIVGTPPTLTNKELVEQCKRTAISKLMESTILLKPYNAPLIAIDARIYNQEEYDRLPSPKISAFNREKLSDKPLFEYRAFAEFIDAYTKNTPDKMNKLLTLSKDMLTGQIMSNPVIAVIKYGNGGHDETYKAIVCDKSTLESLPLPYSVHCRQEFTELGDVIKLEKSTLGSLHAGTSSATPKWERLRQHSAELPIHHQETQVDPASPTRSSAAPTFFASQAANSGYNPHFNHSTGSAAGPHNSAPNPAGRSGNSN
ncbi:MAG: hypothetical protein WBE18_02205 [Gammaproteobacteria bacterium]